MLNKGRHFRSGSAHESRRLKRLADSALEQCASEDLFSAATSGDNAIAVIVKHLSGNLRSRWTDFLTTDGEKADRIRDQEFTITDDDTPERLFARWDEAWQALFNAMQGLQSSDSGSGRHDSPRTTHRGAGDQSIAHTLCLPRGPNRLRREAFQWFPLAESDIPSVAQNNSIAPRRSMSRRTKQHGRASIAETLGGSGNHGYRYIRGDDLWRSQGHAARS